MVHGCRACLKVISNPHDGLFVNNKSTSSTLSLVDKFMDCVPELVLDSITNLVLCYPCVGTLSIAYEFRQKCLETQQNVYGYLQQMPVDTPVDMGKIAKYYNRMKSHQEEEDEEEEEEPPSSPKEKEPNQKIMPHNCNVCSFSCLDKCTFRQHIIMHNTKNPPYKCDECPLRFLSSELLLEHLAGHTLEKPYSCTVCDFLTSSQQSLKEHGWVHRKPFQCTVCWSRFVDENELKKHDVIHKKDSNTKGKTETTDVKHFQNKGEQEVSLFVDDSIFDEGLVPQQTKSEVINVDEYKPDVQIISSTTVTCLKCKINFDTQHSLNEHLKGCFQFNPGFLQQAYNQQQVFQNVPVFGSVQDIPLPDTPTFPQAEIVEQLPVPVAPSTSTSMPNKKVGFVQRVTWRNGSREFLECYTCLKEMPRYELPEHSKTCVSTNIYGVPNVEERPDDRSPRKRQKRRGRGGNQIVARRDLETGRWVCPICVLSAKYSSVMKRHIKRVHQGED